MESVFASYCLHYGKEWLYHSMRSVRDLVDEIFVFYSPEPSHGHSTDLVNPDTREELLDIARKFYAIVVERNFTSEGNHRDYAIKVCRDQGADLVLVVDADEIWDPDVYANMMDHVCNPIFDRALNYGIGMHHFWRSTRWVCDDATMPIRVIRPVTLDTDTRGWKAYSYVSSDDVGKVYHMGYAQKPETIKYKIAIHGHRGEWREGWFNNVFLPWKPGNEDVHPTNENFWTPVLFSDERKRLELLIGDHPYWGLDLIV